MPFPEIPDKRIFCKPFRIMFIVVQNFMIVGVFVKPELNPPVLIEAGKIGLQIPAQFIFLFRCRMGKIRHMKAPAFCHDSGIVEFTVNHERAVRIVRLHDICIGKSKHFFSSVRFSSVSAQSVCGRTDCSANNRKSISVFRGQT